jgi:hypothetical protein
MTGAPRLCVVLLVAFGSACRTVETAPGLDLMPGTQDRVSGAVDTAAFWNPSCDPKKIVVQRVDNSARMPAGMMVEASVCGEVRRYQCIDAQGGCTAWLDVTYLTEPRPAPRN